MVTEIDEELLLTTIRENLLGGREAIVRIRTLQKMYIKRLRKLSKPYYDFELKPAGISAQIKNYLAGKNFERIQGSPSGWVISRKKLKQLCKQYNIEVYPIGTV